MKNRPTKPGFWWCEFQGGEKAVVKVIEVDGSFCYFLDFESRKTRIEADFRDFKWLGPAIPASQAREYAQESFRDGSYRVTDSCIDCAYGDTPPTHNPCAKCTDILKSEWRPMENKNEK